MLLQSVLLSKSVLLATEAVALEILIQSLQHLAILTNVIIEFNTELLASLLDNDEIVWEIVKSVVRTVPFAFGSISPFSDNITLRLLDAGSQIVIYNDEFLKNNATIDSSLAVQEVIGSFPRSRQCLRFHVSADLKFILNSVRQYRNIISSFIISLSEDASATKLASLAADLITSILKQTGPSVDLYLEVSKEMLALADLATILHKHEHLHLAVSPRIHPHRFPIPSTFLSSVLAPAPSLVEYDVIDLFLASIKTDRPDGLITTVVCDERQTCLGLVYSSPASIVQAFVERKGIYWSRSRHQLWRKGDTSGMGQTLTAMRLDCDRDALRFSVTQHGQPPSFCHQMTYTCWGPERGIMHLEHVLQDRLINAPPGSYTQRLFQDSSLLRQKLLEEVQELIEAETADHIAAEAADVIYFLMTRCVQAGIGITDIEHHLDLRSRKISRRPGNAKDWRTKDAEAALKKRDQGAVISQPGEVSEEVLEEQRPLLVDFEAKLLVDEDADVNQGTTSDSK